MKKFLKNNPQKLTAKIDPENGLDEILKGKLLIYEILGEASLQETIQNDPLRQLERARKTLAEKTIVQAAKVIAPLIEDSFSAGFDWCVNQVKKQGEKYLKKIVQKECSKKLFKKITKKV